MKKHGIGLILALLIVAIMLPACAMAATYDLTINNLTHSNAGTLYNVKYNGEPNGTDTLWNILYNRAQSGDMILLPEGTQYLYSGSQPTDIRCDVTIKGTGVGENKTTLKFLYNGSVRGGFRINNNDLQITRTVVLQNLILDGENDSNGTNASDAPYGIYVYGYNGHFELTDVELRNFTSHAIGLWTNRPASDGDYPEPEENARVSVKMVGVKTSGNGATMKLEVPRKDNAQGETLVQIAVDFDNGSSFNDGASGARPIEVRGKRFSSILDGQMEKGMNNVRVNDMYILSDGTLVPVNPLAPAAPADLPQTGDESMLMLWVAACALAISAFVVMKKSYNR